MTDWKDSHKKVLSEYPRKIAHMRKQFQAGRFGLVLGSGVSRPLGVPDWKELNRLVAEDPEVQASECITEDASETIITQRIYEHYRAKKYVINSSSSPQDEIKQELTISRDFGQKLHEHLYSKHDLTENKRIKEIHTYLGCYLNILRNSNLTVNYNFDNYIERLLLEERTQEEKESSRGYETAVNINLPFRRDHRVVYHPNGFLPYEKMESRTNLVFSEKEFANQIIGVMTGHYSSLIHHFCNNTCLFIGISLNDPTLKHILKLVVRINPGRCHYFVHYY